MEARDSGQEAEDSVGEGADEDEESESSKRHPADQSPQSEGSGDIADKIEDTNLKVIEG